MRLKFCIYTFCASNFSNLAPVYFFLFVVYQHRNLTESLGSDRLFHGSSQQHPSDSSSIIESTRTTSMEDVSTRVHEKKNKEYSISKDKAKNYLMYQDIYNCICQNTKKWRYTIHYVKPIQPNCCLKIDFQKVDQHAGGKWLIHDTKRSKDNQLQSLKLPCNKINKIDNRSSRVNVSLSWWRMTDQGPLSIWEKKNHSTLKPH